MKKTLEEVETEMRQYFRSEEIRNNVMRLARELYIYKDWPLGSSFNCALEFFEYQEEFMNDAETIRKIEALAQKKAALVTTPKQQENEPTKVVDSENDLQT